MIVSHFPAKQWLTNKHSLLICEETYQVINKHKNDSYFRPPVGMSSKTQENYCTWKTQLNGNERS